MAIHTQPTSQAIAREIESTAPTTWALSDAELAQVIGGTGDGAPGNPSDNNGQK